VSPWSSQSSVTCVRQHIRLYSTSAAPGPTFSPLSSGARLYGTLPLSPTIQAGGCSCVAAPAAARSTLLLPKRLLFRLSFFKLPSEAESPPGVPGRLPLRDGDAARDPGPPPPIGGGGSRGPRPAVASLDSTGRMAVGADTWRGVLGDDGRGVSGARWLAEDRRFLTLVRRPVDSEGVDDLDLAAEVSCESADELLEKSPDSRLVDFFVGPNMVGIQR
jgi:hypothetical protein